MVVFYKRSDNSKIESKILEFSRSSTILQLKKTLIDLFGITEEFSKLALYNYNDEVKGEILIELDNSNKRDATIYSNKLIDNQNILIDVIDSKSDTLLIANNINLPNYQNLGELLKFESKFKRGLMGLKNNGNTCFMNSPLQCLSKIEKLMQYFVNDKYRSDLNFKNPLGKKGELASAFSRLMKELWSGKSLSISPHDFQWTLYNFEKRFENYGQHDSQEFLAFLLDGLHEDVNKIIEKPNTTNIEVNEESELLANLAKESWKRHKLRNDSIIVDLFQAQLKSKLQCLDCNHVSITFDPFMYISLPLPIDSNRVKSIDIVCRFGIIRCAIQLPRNSSMLQVKQQISQKTGISFSRIVLADVHSSKIHRRFLQNDKFSDISISDDFFAYELQYEISQHIINKVVLTIYQRKSIPQWSSTLNRYYQNFTIFGTPFFIVVDKKIEYNTLISQINKYIRQWIKFPHDQHYGQQIPFTISKIKSTGQTITNFHSFDNSQKFNNKSNNKFNSLITLSYGDILGLDWDLSISNDLIGTPISSKPKEHPDYQTTIIQSQLKSINSISLNDCFKDFTKPEKLELENSWFCSNCKIHKEAIKTLNLWNLPEILIIHLKRFSQSIFNRSKLNTLIEFPIENLDLIDYIDTLSDKKENLKYDLFALSNHYGGLEAGHYTSFVKNFTDDFWYSFDDADVKKIEKNEIITNAAYVLFYKKR